MVMFTEKRRISPKTTTLISREALRKVGYNLLGLTTNTGLRRYGLLTQRFTRSKGWKVFLGCGV